MPTETPPAAPPLPPLPPLPPEQPSSAPAPGLPLCGCPSWPATPSPPLPASFATNSLEARTTEELRTSSAIDAPPAFPAVPGAPPQPPAPPPRRHRRRGCSSPSQRPCHHRRLGRVFLDCRPYLGPPARIELATLALGNHLSSPHSPPLRAAPPAHSPARAAHIRRCGTACSGWSTACWPGDWGPGEEPSSLIGSSRVPSGDAGTGSEPRSPPPPASDRARGG